MTYEKSLVKGKLLKRYKRFLADVELYDTQDVVTAHCPNPGSMMGLKEPGIDVWLSQAPENSNRKLKYTWELACHNGEIVGVHTNRTNDLVYEALLQKRIPEVTQYEIIHREMPYGQNSRVDFLLEKPDKSLCYLEVKNVNLKRAEHAEFPDAVTKRGAKHLRELTNVVQQGHQAILLYVVQRADCHAFRIADDIDPNYAMESLKAHAAGVGKICYYCHVSELGISIAGPLKILTP